MCILSLPQTYKPLFHLSFDMDMTDFGEMGRREVRLYLQEGPVKIITVMETLSACALLASGHFHSGLPLEGRNCPIVY